MSKCGEYNGAVKYDLCISCAKASMNTGVARQVDMPYTLAIQADRPSLFDLYKFENTKTYNPINESRNMTTNS